MDTFVQRFAGKIKGVISGFDRIVFKGCLRPLMFANGAMAFLRSRGVLNKDYKAWVMAQSEALVEAVNKDKERMAVQVKRSKNKITRKAISDAVAGMKYYNCTKAMVVTNSKFTEDAREFARGTECILIDRTILQQWLDSLKMAGTRVLP